MPLRTKIATFLLLTFFSLPLMTNAQSAIDPNFFTDVNQATPNSSSIESLKLENVIHGYSDGTFKPGLTINRAEFATIVVNALKLEAKGSNCFSDIKDEWFAAAICTLKEKGVINGYADGTFQPARNINLVEAAKIVVNANNLPTQSGNNWFEPFIKALESKNFIPTSIDKLDQKLSRAEVVEMIYRVLNNDSSRTSKTLVSLNSEVPTISSCAELEERITTSQYRSNQYYYLEDDEESFPDAVPAETSAQKSVSNEPGIGGGDSDDYSTTNIQVENVDESDVMKNDGSHIYFIQGKTVKIVQAYPATDMKEVATIEADTNFYPTSLYLNENLNQLIILGTNYSSSLLNTSQATEVYVYSLSTISKPEQVRKLSLPGYEVSSRRVDNNLYLVLRQYQPYYHYNYYQKFSPISEDIASQPLEETLPSYYDSASGKTEKLAGCNQITYFPHHPSVDYLIVAGIPLDSSEKSIHRQVMLGASENIYASKDNLYVASTGYDYDDYLIYDTWATTPAKYSYNNTNLYRFALNDGKVEYKDKGRVPGRIINQFSMDENEEAFKIATTSDGSTTSNNNLYLLNKNNLSEVLGKIENIAPGEVIYSTRFVGDKAYMVTFKTTDPLFVIDTSDAKNPKILGKLKIPGYSNYLHPFDENHIIGLGKEATADKNGDFAWYKGVKLALFDISDVNNPIELSNVVIGDRGTESEALSNHRAILFSKEKGFIAFPITIAEHQETPVEESSYGEYTFQGAHVYNINTLDGITLRGSITHYTDQDDVFLKAASYWYPHVKDIKRILYIGENFYTVSDGMIKASDIDNLKETKSIELEVKNQDYYNSYE